MGVTIADFEEIFEPDKDDYHYLVRGVGVGRDKKIIHKRIQKPWRYSKVTPGIGGACQFTGFASGSKIEMVNCTNPGTPYFIAAFGNLSPSNPQAEFTWLTKSSAVDIWWYSTPPSTPLTPEIDNCRHVCVFDFDSSSPWYTYVVTIGEKTNTVLQTWYVDFGAGSSVGCSSIGTATAIDSGMTKGGPFGLCALNSTDIVLIDSGNEEIRTYRFNGSTWSQIGNSFDLNTFMGGGIGSPTLIALNKTDILFTDDTNRRFHIFRFDGTDWISVSIEMILTLNLGALTLCSLNGLEFIIIEGTGHQGTTWRLHGFWGMPYKIGHPDWI